MDFNGEAGRTSNTNATTVSMLSFINQNLLDTDVELRHRGARERLSIRTSAQMMSFIAQNMLHEEDTKETNPEDHIPLVSESEWDSVIEQLKNEKQSNKRVEPEVGTKIVLEIPVYLQSIVEFEECKPLLIYEHVSTSNKNSNSSKATGLIDNIDKRNGFAPDISHATKAQIKLDCNEILAVETKTAQVILANHTTSNLSDKSLGNTQEQTISPTESTKNKKNDKEKKSIKKRFMNFLRSSKRTFKKKQTQS